MNTDSTLTKAAKIRPLSGFPEYRPAERIVVQSVVATIERVFQLHGFVSIETRAVEPVDRLLGKGGDADKEIYGVQRLAAEAGEEAQLGLHFDLTVPFARYVIENAGQLHFPFRRYQIQKVWRGERPQEGRYREFTQADIDVVAPDALPDHLESELPLVMADVFAALPLPAPMIIQGNNRLIPEGFYAGLGITDIAGTLRIIDKLDKIGPDKVRTLLTNAGLNAEQAESALKLASIRTADTSFVDQVRELGVSNPTLEEGLVKLACVIEQVNQYRPGAIVADLKIARGLDYYTGVVFESQLVGFEQWGSFCSGGRYDSLATDGRTTYPGIGLSIGVDRLIGLLLARGLLSATRSTPSAVLVAVTDEASRRRSIEIAMALRGRGIACEIAPSADKFGKQIKFAERRGIPYVWFPGDGADQVKDIRSGEQIEASATDWVCPVEDLAPTLIRSS